MDDLFVREKEILEYITPYFEEQFEKSCSDIHHACMKNAVEFCENFLVPFETIFQKAQILQMMDTESLFISCLRSGIDTGGCQLRIDLSGPEFWLDENPLSEYITLPCIFDFLDKDIGFFTELIKKKFIRLQPCELKSVRQEYAAYYFSLVLQIMTDFSEPIISLSDSISKSDHFEILYGEHMGQYVKIC